MEPVNSGLNFDTAPSLDWNLRGLGIQRWLISWRGVLNPRMRECHDEWLGHSELNRFERLKVTRVIR